MAVITRRYNFRGANENQLQRTLDPGITIVPPDYVIKVDVTFDDAISTIAAVDFQMARFSCIPEPAPTTGDPFIGLRSPAGTLFKLEVGDSGVLVTQAALTRNYVSGLEASFLTVASIQLASGRARSDDNAFGLILTAPATINLTVAGVGGLDSGVEAASTWYFAWLIGDSTGVNPTAGLFSVSSVAPVMPAGYDRRRLVGVVRNNAGSDIIQFSQFGVGSDRTVYYLTAITNRQILTNGVATVRTNVSAANFVPPTSRHGIFDVDTLGVGANIFAGVDGGAIHVVTAGRSILGSVLPVDATQQLAYQNLLVAGDTDIFVAGFQVTI